jgi:hypothetical protein
MPTTKKMAAIARNLETLLQEMVATREESRALIALMTRVADKMEALVRKIEETKS